METRVTWRRRIKRGQFKKKTLYGWRGGGHHDMLKKDSPSRLHQWFHSKLSLSIDTLCCCHKFRNENVFIYAKTLVVCLVQPQIIYTEFKRVGRKKRKRERQLCPFLFQTTVGYARFHLLWGFVNHVISFAPSWRRAAWNKTTKGKFVCEMTQLNEKERDFIKKRRIGSISFRHPTTKTGESR